jgi:uncharacterized protein
MKKEEVFIQSLGDRLAAVLFLPETASPAPALIVCHGALEFKEDFFEFCEFLAGKGIAALALDMHGHGQSQGERYHVEMRVWVADVRAAADFLQSRPGVDGRCIGALGLSSGGTAILEAALVDPRLKTLVAMDATVRNTLGFAETVVFQALILAGRIKKSFTKKDLRFPVIKLFAGVHVVSDPEVDREVQSDPRFVDAFSSFPLPGAAQCFFVDTLKRAGRITAPTLVLWGEEDRLDSPKTARLLYAALTCKKQLRIVPGNGHLGHLDRNKAQVFALTAAWALENLAAG